jgi:O-antigen ligase
MTVDVPAPFGVRRLFRGGLMVMPYVSYLGMLGVGAALIWLLVRFRRTGLDAVTRWGLWGLFGVLALSSGLAYDRAEAFLQLTNFLPYMLLFTVLPFLLPTTAHLERLARSLLWAMLPLNLLGLLQYGLRLPQVPLAVQQWSVVDWVRNAAHQGRVMVTFDHPNTYASFLVVIFGLGLGLVLQPMLIARQTPKLYSKLRGWGKPEMGMAIATFSCFLGIFASGSRNGILVAATQVLLFMAVVLVVRGSVWLLLGSIAGLAAVIAGLFRWGIGGRSLSLAMAWADDPRMNVWRIAVDLMRDRPWFGWGLGNYKFLYPTRGIDPEISKMFHPHNIWLLLGAETGVLVLLGFMLWVGGICYGAGRSLASGHLQVPDQAVLLGYLLGFWGCVAYAQFDITFYDVRVNCLNWVVLGGLYGFSRLGGVAFAASKRAHLPPA